MNPHCYLLPDDIRGWIPLDAALTFTQLSRSQLAYEVLKRMVRVGCTLDGCAALSRPYKEVRLSGFYVLFPNTAFQVITEGRAEVHEVWSLDMEWFELRGDADPPRTLDKALRYGVAPRRFPTVTDEHLLFNRTDLEYYNLPAGTSERKTGPSRRGKKKNFRRLRLLSY